MEKSDKSTIEKAAEAVNTATGEIVPAPPTGNLPKGMQMVSDGQLAEAVNWEVGMVIQGNIINRKSATVQDGKRLVERELLVIDTGKDRVAVWEAAGLKDLFAMAKPGGEVYIEHYGLQELGGARAPMRLFVVGYNADTEYDRQQ